MHAAGGLLVCTTKLAGMIGVAEDAETRSALEDLELGCDSLLRFGAKRTTQRGE